jgi:phosphatidate phosphatase APP1
VIVKLNGTLATNQTGIPLQTTDDVGEIQQFITIPKLNTTDVSKVQIVELGVYNVSGPGNTTAILVPSSGISVVSDIDDVLRVTQVYVPNKGLFNSFVQPYVNEA